MNKLLQLTATRILMAFIILASYISPLRMDRRGLSVRGYVIMAGAIFLGTMIASFITPLLGAFGQNVWIGFLVIAGMVYVVFVFVQKRFGKGGM